MTEKIAIIGGGVAGLTAGYLLHEHCDVTLFEKDNRLGGNVYTLETKNGEEIDISVFSIPDWNTPISQNYYQNLV